MRIVGLQLIYGAGESLNTLLSVENRYLFAYIGGIGAEFCRKKQLHATTSFRMQTYAQSIYWFRNDLRVADNFALLQAIAQSKHLIPLYVINPDVFSNTAFGFPRTGAFRTQFLLESLLNLRQQLQHLGSDLVIRIGKPEKCVVDVANKYCTEALFFGKEFADEEQKTEIELQKKLKNCHFHSYLQNTLLQPQQLPFEISALPSVFTDFRKAVETKAWEIITHPPPQRLPPLPKDLETGQLPTIHQLGIAPKPISEKSAFPFKGGAFAAQQRLHDYIWTTQGIAQYKETRNGLIGTEYSGKFSAWLANGSLSARQIYSEVKAYEQKNGANESTYWMIFELLWRDYFRFMAQKVGNDWFKLPGIQHRTYKWKQDERLLETIFHAQTGIPFIDANLRELLETGWMSNRGRQNVAHFFARHLELDWRIGAAFFEAFLIDYDVYSNYGNWQYCSGVGNDPRNRQFNILHQAKQYDPQGKFVKLWIPELKRIPPAFVHHPWLLSHRDLNIANVKLGQTYPRPIIGLGSDKAKSPQKKRR